MKIFCPECNNLLIVPINTIWYVCKHSQCYLSYPSKKGMILGVHKLLKDYRLPLNRRTAYSCYASFDFNVIIISNYSGKVVTNIPYIPLNHDNVKITIDKILSLLVYL